MGHQFVGFLGGCVKADGMVYIVLDTEGQVRISAIDGTGRSINQMLHIRVPAAFQDIHEAQNIGVYIGAGIFDGVPHTRLSCEMDDGVKPCVPEN